MAEDNKVCSLQRLVLLFFGVFGVILLGITIAVLAVVVRQTEPGANTNGQSNFQALQPLIKPLPVADNTGLNNQNSLEKYYFNVGMRSDPLLQECQGPQMKMSFPDLDYVFLGYNIMKGYPLEVGHDPGFTLPIFQANYQEGHQTADCRYSVPKGVTLIPDVACITSFSSEVVQTKYEHTESLSTLAEAKGSGFGVSFSASTGYKKTSAIISNGESVFIISEASCDYYYSRLLPESPPPFHSTFINWVKRLDRAGENNQTYIDFLERYGTHFLSEVTFGATFVFEHEMKANLYQTMSEQNINVAVSASYDGLISISGGFSLDSSQREAASNFRKSVTTKTITRGAPPPANGDALTWASSVKESPVPVRYQLLGIENIFTEEYMNGFNVNYDAIRTRLQQQQANYCPYLKSKGQVDSCTDIVPGLVLKNTRLYNDSRQLITNIRTCQDLCSQDEGCIAVGKCIRCTRPEYYRFCYHYSDKRSVWATEDADWDSTIFRPKIVEKMKLVRTIFQGVNRNERPNKASSLSECFEWCKQDEFCIAYSFCPSMSNACLFPQNCLLFGQSITGAIKDDNTESYVLGLQYRMTLNTKK